jgi:hypothetical protein
VKDKKKEKGTDGRAFIKKKGVFEKILSKRKNKDEFLTDE